VRAFGSSTLPSTIDCAKSETGGRMQMALNKRSLNKPIGHQLSSRRAEPKACLPAGARGELVRRGSARSERTVRRPAANGIDRSFGKLHRYGDSPNRPMEIVATGAGRLSQPPLARFFPMR